MAEHKIATQQSFQYRLFRFLQEFLYNLGSKVLFKNDKAFGLCLTANSYSPWREDADFIALYKQLTNYTLVDEFRCYELWALLKETRHCPNGAILEVGVWRGGTGMLLAGQAQRMNLNVTTYLCDTFEGVVKAGENDNKYVGGEHGDTSEKLVSDKVNQLQIKNVKILKGIFPDDTAHLVTEGTFRFCHIDVDVYDSAKSVFEWVWPKMEKNGIIVFDDYGFFGCAGVRKFVNEQRELPGRITLHNTNGHAIVIKL